MMSPTGPSPNPNVPSEYCSTIPPLQQARAAGTLNSPPPTVMVPVSVLKHPSNDGKVILTQSLHRLYLSLVFLNCTPEDTSFFCVIRLSSWAKARVVCWWYLTQWRGGRHCQAVCDEPQELPRVQWCHPRWDNSKAIILIAHLSGFHLFRTL